MIGILFATQREADPLLRRLAARPDGEDPFPCWTFGGAEVGVVLVSGMGKEVAARGAEHLIVSRKATEVVNAGICGAAADSHRIGEVYRVTEVVDGDDPEAGAVACVPGRWGQLPTARLITCSEPVFDPARREGIAAHGELVDMEGVAVARTCRQHGVPCTGLKGISDQADGGGREMLQQNIDPVSERVAEAVAGGLLAPPGGDVSLGVKLLRFTKIEHTLFSLPLLFTGAWLGAGRQLPSLTDLLLVALAGVGARVLGMSMNRILDCKLDALNPRTANRELPAGQMSLATAAAVAAVGLVVYLLACVLLNPLTLALSPIPAAVLIGYSLLKRFTPLCHFGIGICLGLAPLGAYVAVSGEIPAGASIYLLAAFTFCWISGFDIIYALQDIAADRANGVHSMPAALGYTGAQVVSGIVHATALAAVTILLLTTGGGPLAWLAWSVAAAAFVAAYLPVIPLPARFFPLSVVAGIAGAVVPLLGGV